MFTQQQQNTENVKSLTTYAKAFGNTRQNSPLALFRTVKPQIHHHHNCNKLTNKICQQHNSTLS